MSATVHIPEVWATEVEVVAVGIACVDAEVPVSSLPVEWAIEVGGSEIGLILPVEQDVAQVEVALLPVDAIEVGLGVDTHQVVKIHFVGGLVLLLGQVKLVSHLVGEEQCLLACLLIAHCIGCHCHGDQCCQGDQYSLHSCMIFVVNTLCYCFTMQNCEENIALQKDFP